MYGIRFVIGIIRVVVYKKIWRGRTVIELLAQKSIAKKEEVRVRREEVQNHLSDAAFLMALRQYEMKGTHRGSLNVDASGPIEMSASFKPDSPLSSRRWVPVAVQRLFRSQKDQMTRHEFDQISKFGKLSGRGELSGRGDVFLPTERKETETLEPNLGS